MQKLLIAVCLLVSGCASLTKDGGAVRFFAGNLPPECSYIGNVIGSGVSGFASAEYEPAKRDLRNKTAAIGGNFVRISNYGGAFSKEVEGEAYKCPQNVHTVVVEPTTEEKMARQMERQNDIAERQQRNEAIQNFQRTIAPPQQQPYQMPVNRPVQTNCNRIGNQVNCTSY